MTVPNRVLAESFGAGAKQYDQARPAYPAALIDDLLAGNARDVLDIGCGTGIAGRLFQARGGQVLGVEPDARMAGVARAHGLTVEIARFEDWDPAGRTFDLLISGQAWHWIEPVAGLTTISRILRPGGVFAPFWNSVTHPPDVRAVLESAYQATTPELISTSVALGSLRPMAGAAGDAARDALAGTGLFAEVTRRSYDWDRTHTPEQWIEEISTHSAVLTLDAGRREAFVAATRAGLAAIGPFTVRYQTNALIARAA
jgi:SAM-dependent methyltransferase